MNSQRPRRQRLPVEAVCSRITSGGTPLRSNRRFYEGGSIRWVKTGELKDWYIEDTEEKITEEAIRESSAKLLPSGTVLMAMYGDGRTITSLGILRHESASNQASCAMIANPAVCSPLFLFYSLKAHRRAFLKLAYGGAQRNLNAKTIRQFEIEVPPTATQTRIASILAAYDDLIENETRRIKILEQMAQMLYREWFIDFRFPGYENVPMVESESGPVPDGWSIQSVGTISENSDSKRRPLSSMQRAKRPGPYPYYGAARIFDFVDDYIFDGRYLLFAEDGSVITDDGRPVLQLTNGKFWPNNHTHVLNGRSPISTYFLYLTMRQVDISGYITGAAQPKITQANLNRIPVIVAPTDILLSFESLCAPMLDHVAVLERKQVNLRKTRDFLLPKLISGEVPVEAVDEAAAEFMEQTA